MPDYNYFDHLSSSYDDHESYSENELEIGTLEELDEVPVDDDHVGALNSLNPHTKT